MKRYRLSKAAVPFFKEDLATKIGDYQFWQAYNVDERNSKYSALLDKLYLLEQTEKKV